MIDLTTEIVVSTAAGKDINLADPAFLKVSSL